MSTSTVITFAADSSVATFFLKTKNLKDFCSPAGHPPSLITELDCCNITPQYLAKQRSERFVQDCDWRVCSQLETETETDQGNIENRCTHTITPLTAMYLNWRCGEAASGKHESQSLSCRTHWNTQKTLLCSRPSRCVCSFLFPLQQNSLRQKLTARKYIPT